MVISKNEPLTTFRSIESISIAFFHAERSYNKDTFFSVTLQIDPIWFEDEFLDDRFDFYKQKV